MASFILNGDLIPDEESRVGLPYKGDRWIESCFETMLLKNATIPLLSYHLDRMNRSLAYLGWPKPVELGLEELSEAVIALFEANRFLEDQHYRCRLTLAADHQIAPDDIGGWVLEAKPVDHPTSPYHLHTISLESFIFPPNARYCKLSNRTFYQDAYRLAAEHHKDDALLIDPNGFVSESTIANILWSKHDAWFTAAVESGALQGVGVGYLRGVMYRDDQYIIDSLVTLDDLMNADGIWLINALRGPVQIRSIDNIETPVNDRHHAVLLDRFWGNLGV